MQKARLLGLTKIAAPDSHYKTITKLTPSISGLLFLKNSTWDTLIGINFYKAIQDFENPFWMFSLNTRFSGRAALHWQRIKEKGKSLPIL